MQITNLFFWFLPNVYIIAGLSHAPPSCRWFSDMTNACGVLRYALALLNIFSSKYPAQLVHIHLAT